MLLTLFTVFKSLIIFSSTSLKDIHSSVYTEMNIVVILLFHLMAMFVLIQKSFHGHFTLSHSLSVLIVLIVLMIIKKKKAASQMRFKP